MLNKPRILLVDDQPSVVQVYVGVLEQNSFDVDTAIDGQSALDMLYSKRYDTVVADLIMPPGQSGGLWLVTAIRRVSKSLPIIILSGKGTVPQAVEAMKSGADDYIVKDELARGDLQSLVDCINDLLRDDKSKAFGMDVLGDWIGYEEGIRLVELGLRELCAQRLGNKARRQIEHLLSQKEIDKILARCSRQLGDDELLRELSLGQLVQLVTDNRAYSHWNDVFSKKSDLQQRLQRIVRVRNQLAHHKGEINILDLKQVEVDVNHILQRLQRISV